jgi:predicted 3-demethylubiquinone-9 3-methyltransferase (glyoxalase superfamily)
MQKITPFLWFDDQAEEAARFYASVFKRSEILTVTRYGPDGPRPEGSVMTVAFRIEGQDFVALNGGPQFTFSPAISLVVNCETQKEIDEMWETLSEGGAKVQCGWLTDKYGLSWQIVPATLGELLNQKHPEKANRVMKALLQMEKIDLKKLQQAYAER